MSMKWCNGVCWLACSLLWVSLAGCGGDDGEPSATGNDEIAAFIEQNPEYGANPPASSDRTQLGLER